MIFGKKNKEGHRAVNLAHFDGLDCFSRGWNVQVSLNDDSQCLTIKSRIGKNYPVVNLKYRQITGINVVSEKEIIEQSKSVVGRAAIGGVLLGPLGAIVGGMSGIGNKKQSDTHYFMVINYKSKEDETEILSFEIVGASLRWSSFYDELKKKIQKEENHIKGKEINL